MAFEPKASNLTNGKIPAGQPCPYWDKCAIAREEQCAHKGESHSVDFSCGAARFLDMNHKLGT